MGLQGSALSLILLGGFSGGCAGSAGAREPTTTTEPATSGAQATPQQDAGNQPENGKSPAPPPGLKQVALAPGLMMLQSQCCNAGVAKSDTGSLLVDTMMKGGGSEAIAETLADAGFGKTKLIVNTHGHPDHVGGNDSMARQGAVVVGHEKIRGRLSVEQRMDLLGFSLPPWPATTLPTIEVDGEMWLHFGERVHIFNVENAHSDADSIVHFTESNVIFMGDIFVNGMYPLIFVEQGGSIDGLLKSVDRIIALSDDGTKIVPGHGPLSGKAGLLHYRDTLATIRSRIAKQIKSGKTLPDVLAARPTKEFDEDWDWQLMDGTKFTRVLYRSLSERRN